MHKALSASYVYVDASFNTLKNRARTHISTYLLTMSVSYVQTPEPSVPAPSSTKTGVRTTELPCIKNGELVVEGAGALSFSNTLMIFLLLAIPYLLKRSVFRFGGIYTYVFLVLVCAIPILMAYWTIYSNFSPFLRDDVKLPGLPVEHYIDIKDPELKSKYFGHNKIPYEVFWEAYFDGKIDIKGDMLEVLEMRYDWCKFTFTRGLFKFFLLGMIPEVIMHSRSQDEEQVQDHYDRGDDFYSWFLGPRMIYTSGVIRDINRVESLEELQDNKLRVVAEKLAAKPGDQCLDIGCGWGTLARFLSSQYGAKVTGVTLGRNQTAWGNGGLRKDGVPESQSRIVNCDYRDAPYPSDGRKYDKITALEMSEHVGVRNFSSFLQQCYDMLEDDGVFFLQYSGIRKSWQYEDLQWGLFMNKYIFPGADASTPLGWTVDRLEGTGFEITGIDTIGVHYSATLYNWYRNWMANKENVLSKYGKRWFRIWEFFLASSTIVARQGSATCYQITMRKNLNRVHRAEYIPNQFGLKVPGEGKKWLQE